MPRCLRHPKTRPACTQASDPLAEFRGKLDVGVGAEQPHSLPLDQSQAEQGEPLFVPEKPAGGFFVDRPQAVELQHAGVMGKVLGLLGGDLREGVELDVAGVATEVGGCRGRHQRCPVELEASRMLAERAGELAADRLDAVEPEGSPVSAELLGGGERQHRHMIQIDMLKPGQRRGMPCGEHAASSVFAQLEVLRLAELAKKHPIPG